jgi:molybdopterin molybdotransferase
MSGGLLDPEAARERVLAAVAPLPSEPVPLGEALGRVLAEPARASDDVPAFDNSAMDGYAVRAADLAGAGPSAPVALAVVGESRAGHPSGVGPGAGEAIRISTGAMLPAGADAVVRQEDASEDGEGRVEILVEDSPGANVRRAGEDIRAGERVIAAGTRLGPAEIGVLASVGVADPRCSRRPGVRIVVTGDELVGPAEDLPAGGVRNSNAFTLTALATSEGARVESTRMVGDDRQDTVAALREGLDSDLLAISGGVSVGPHDHVKPALSELGVEERFWGIALRPGKPTWFGTHSDGALVLGLPGNPVSAMVTFHLLAAAALRAMAGIDTASPRTTATIDEPYAKRPGRAHAVRCRVAIRDDGLHVRPTGEQGSHVLTSMLGAEALAWIEADRGDVAAGERVEVELLGVPGGLR